MILKSIFLGIFSTIILNIAYAQYNWEQIPVSDSIKIRSIYFHDADSYLGTENGVYYSNDQFETIEHIGLENQIVLTLLVTSNNELLTSSTGLVYKYLGNGEWQNLSSIQSSVICMYESDNGDLYIGSWGYIHKSTDQGNTWNIVFESYNMEGINDIYEGDNGLLFAGSTSLVGTGHPGGLYRSDDNGETWVLVSLEYHFISSIVSNSQNELFVGTQGHWQTGGGLVLKSLDSLGMTWVEKFNDNLIADMCINEFNTLFIGCKREGYNGGVFCSFDNGDSWEDLSGNLPNRYISEIGVNSLNLVYILMYASHNLYMLTDTITSTSTLPSINISVYPNPTSDYIIIENPINIINKVTLTNLYGQVELLIRPESTQNNEIIIDFRDFDKGIYIVTVESENFSESTKIIKN